MAAGTAVFAPLIGQTTEHFNVARVMGDKAYSSYANLELAVGKGAEPFIPFKSYAKGTSRSQTWNKLFAYFILNREEFLAAYHKRSNVESTFSSIKRVFGDSVRSKTLKSCLFEFSRFLSQISRCKTIYNFTMRFNPSPVFPSLKVPSTSVDNSHYQNRRPSQLPMAKDLIAVNQNVLTPAQFGDLAEVPPELEWLANFTNAKTRRAYHAAKQAS